MQGECDGRGNLRRRVLLRQVQQKREAKGNVVVNAKGTKMAKGKCPVCGTNLNRILGRA